MGEVLAKHNKSQLRIAETEKYAHVTFFLSGGREDTYTGEERALLASPKVATYDLKPEMSAPEVTAELISCIESERFDAIICNYANPDMVGHTGDYQAAMESVNVVSQCVERVIASMAEVGGETLITADHGNVEIMYDEDTQQPHTQHTTLPVPLVYVGNRSLSLDSGGSLADIAPTMLDLMNYLNQRNVRPLSDKRVMGTPRSSIAVSRFALDNYKTIFVSVLVAVLLSDSSWSNEAREAQLNQLKADISRIQQRLTKQSVTYSDLEKSLRRLDLQVSRTLLDIRNLNRDIDSLETQIILAEKEKQQLQMSIKSQAETITGELLSAQKLGAQEPIKLLLNQEDPEKFSRILKYYDYFLRARVKKLLPTIPASNSMIISYRLLKKISSNCYEKLRH